MTPQKILLVLGLTLISLTLSVHHALAESFDPNDPVASIIEKLDDISLPIFNSESAKQPPANVFIAIGIDPITHKPLGTFLRQGSIEVNRPYLAAWENRFPSGTQIKSYGYYSTNAQHDLDEFSKRFNAALAGHQNNALSAWHDPQLAAIRPYDAVDIDTALVTYTPESWTAPFYCLVLITDPHDQVQFSRLNGHRDFETLEANIAQSRSASLNKTKVFLFENRHDRDHSFHRLQVAQLASTKANILYPEQIPPSAKETLFAVEVDSSAYVFFPKRWTGNNLHPNDDEDVYLFHSRSEAELFYNQVRELLIKTNSGETA